MRAYPAHRAAARSIHRFTYSRGACRRRRGPCQKILKRLRL